MPLSEITCWSCHKTWEYTPPMARGESCDDCGWDARVCRNCRFYDRHAYNECLEEQSELVKDKDRRNFCSYFESRASGQGAKEKADENPLDKLFGGSDEPRAKSKLEEDMENFFRK